jgi:hypothetical protein
MTWVLALFLIFGIYCWLTNSASSRYDAEGEARELYEEISGKPFPRQLKPVTWLQIG